MIESLRRPASLGRPPSFRLSLPDDFQAGATWRPIVLADSPQARPTGLIQRLKDRRAPKAADIETDVLLGLIAMRSVEARGMGWVQCWDMADWYPDLPWKVVHAKLRRLIRRRRLTGCGCGCRGDYALTHRSIDRLANRGYLDDERTDQLRRIADLNRI